MTITAPVLLAVLLGALLHASWNALIKSSTDTSLDTALIHGLAALLALPLLALTGWPIAAAWPFILASTAIHFGYYAALSAAYRHGDLGLTYPLMRGTAPLLVALGSHAAFGEALSVTAWLGVAAVSAGVLMLGLSRPGGSRGVGHAKAVRYALLNAAIIAAYTLVDGRGVRASGDAAAYVCALFLLEGLPFGAFVLWRRRAEMPAVRAYARRRWPLAVVGASASLASYGIALWAMTRAPVATVAALRETSVLFAAVIGTFILRERFGAQRALGTAVVLAGVVALRMA